MRVIASSSPLPIRLGQPIEPTSGKRSNRLIVLPEVQTDLRAERRGRIFGIWVSDGCRARVLDIPGKERDQAGVLMSCKLDAELADQLPGLCLPAEVEVAGSFLGE